MTARPLAGQPTPLRPPSSAAASSQPVPATRHWTSWWPAYWALAAIWGASFLFIKIGVGELHPIYVTLYRCVAGAGALLVVVLLTGERLALDRRLWAHLAVVALVANVLPYTLLGYAELRISSIVAGIWNATTPLMVLLVSLAVLRSERPTWRLVAGLVTGFLGVLVVLGVWHGVGSGALVGQLCSAGAAACYGVAIPYTRRVLAGRTESGPSLAAIQLVLASAELVVVAPLLAGRPVPPTSLSPAVVGSVAALGALGTGLAYWLFFRVIRVAGAHTAASVTYVLPLFATLLGVLVLGEPLHWYEPVGGVVILLGIAVAQGVPPSRAGRITRRCSRAAAAAVRRQRARSTR